MKLNLRCFTGVTCSVYLKAWFSLALSCGFSDVWYGTGLSHSQGYQQGYFLILQPYYL